MNTQNTFRIATYGKHDIVSNSILSHGHWEPKTVAFLKQALSEQEGSVFLDIGANIGYFTLYVAALGYHVIAVEASQENANLIRYSLCLNPSLKSRIRLVQVALAEKRMRCFLVSSEGNSGNMNMDCREDRRALHFRGWNHWSGKKEREENAVRTVPLDEIVSLNERVDVLRIDTEGFEYHALVGGQKHVLPKVRYVFSEFSPFMLRTQHTDPLKYLELLQKHGLHVYHEDKQVQNFAAFVASVSRYTILDISAKRKTKSMPPLSTRPMDSSLLYKTHVVLGTHLTVGTRDVEHAELIRGHLQREENVYQLTLHAIEESQSKLVVDAGSNHGAVAIFAAMQGAEVDAVEMQEDLSKVVSNNARANGVTVNVLHAAIASSLGTVSYSGHQIAEGAVAHLTPPSRSAPSAASITLDHLIESRQVAMLKIDVEGADLIALSSADASFAARRVNHSIVEFGPPSRWMAVTGQSAVDGARVMGLIRQHDYHVRLVRSLVWSTAKHRMSDPTIRKATRFGLEYIDLTNEADDEQLVEAMVTCDCESYLWFAARQ